MFKNMLKMIPFSFTRAAGDYIGISLNSNNLKLTHIQSGFNKIELSNIACHAITAMAEGDIVKLLAASFHEMSARHAQVIMIIPSHAVITKNIEIPSTDPREIREIINLQAGRHTPYSREEIIVDYIELGTYKGSYTKILLVIVTAVSVKKLLDIIAKAGIRQERVVFAMEGIACFAQKFLQVETSHNPVTLIHVDESFTDFAVIFKHKPVFLRSIPLGAQHIAGEKEKYEAQFVEELKKSLEAYQSEDIERIPQTIVLIGAVDELSGWEAILEATFHFPVKHIPSFKNIAIAPAAFHKVSSLSSRVSFVDVIAPLAVQAETKVELISEDIKLRLSLEARGSDLMKTGVLTFAAFILIFFLMLSILYFKSSYLKKLDLKYSAFAHEAAALKKDFDKNTLIESYVKTHGYSVELLTGLYELVPLEVALQDVRFEKQGKLQIRGIAESMSTVFLFSDTLKKSKYFTDIRIGSTSRRKEDAKDVTDFEITASFGKIPE